MKNLLISLLLIICIAAIGFFGYKAIIQKPVESVQDEQVVFTTHIDGFTTSRDAVLYRRHMFIQHTYDSVFIHMPADIVEQVAYVLIEKNGQTTKEDIVDEYLINTEIYDAILKKQKNEGNSEIIIEEQNPSENPSENSPLPSLRESTLSKEQDSTKNERN